MSFSKNLLVGIAVTLSAMHFSIFTARCEDSGGYSSYEVADGANVDVDPDSPLISVYANDIAAIVNNEIVTMAQVMRAVAALLPQIRAESRSQEDFNKKVRSAEELVLNAIVEKILIIDDFKEKGGQVPDNFWKKEYEAHVRNRFHGDRVAFAKYLRESGRSMKEFKKDIVENAIVSLVLGDALKAKAEISPAKIREYYDEHLYDFVVDRQVFVTTIAMAKKSYGDDELQSKLSDVMAAIKAGKDIQSITATFGYLKKNQIGWVAVDQLIPEFSNAVRGLQAGESSDPVTVADKIYILFVSDERPPKKFAVSEVSSDIEKILAAKYQAEAKDNYIKKLKERAYIKIFL